ncbi:forkhead box [Gurleya vavrai]
MNNKEKEIDDAVEAMLMLSKQKKEDVCDEFPYAILTGKGWKEYITTPGFFIDISDIKLHFTFDEFDKVWRMNVIKGYVIIEKIMYGLHSRVVIEDNSKIDVGLYDFVFQYTIKPRKLQKSYQRIIVDALESTKDGKMTLAQIYDYFILHAGFSLDGSMTWKNSIRHNLSLNKMFIKVPRDENGKPGKGAFWSIDKTFYELNQWQIKKVANLRPSNLYYTGDGYLDTKKQPVEKILCQNLAAQQYHYNSNIKNKDQDYFNAITFRFNNPINKRKLYRRKIKRRKKRKLINDERGSLKRRKIDDFIRKDSSSDDEDNNSVANSYTETNHYMEHIDKDIFCIENLDFSKLKRSQSIIELPEELALLSLESNKKSKSKK